MQNVKETNLVNIGVKIDEASVNTTADSIVKLLDTAAKNHTNDEVILAALNVLKASASISNLTFDGFNVTSDNSRKTEINIKSDENTPVEFTNGIKVENPYG